MKFSIQSQVEKLIANGRISTAIKKLQKFTKGNDDYNEIYNELVSLSGRLTSIDKNDFENARAKEEAAVIRNNIVERIQQIIDEIEELSETRDRDLILGWTWKILTGLMVPIALVFIAHSLTNKKGQADFCPSIFNNATQCKMLVLEFLSPSNNTQDIPEQIVGSILNDNTLNEILIAGKYGDEESKGIEVAKQLIAEKTCNADFVFTGLADKVGDRISVLYKTEPEPDSLAKSLNVPRDTLEWMEFTNVTKNIVFQNFLIRLACIHCKKTLQEHPLYTQIMRSAASNVDTIADVMERQIANFQLVHAYYALQNYGAADRLLTKVIESEGAPLKAFAYRGKIRSELNQFENAITDYSTFLTRKENEKVRLERFNATYNLLQNNTWENRFAEYVEEAKTDADVIENKVPSRQKEIISRQWQEIREKSPATLTTENNSNCTYCGKVFDRSGQSIVNARVFIAGVDTLHTNANGAFQSGRIPCGDNNARSITVIMKGFQAYEGSIGANHCNTRIVLENNSRNCSFKGTFLNANNQPVHDATIHIRGFDPVKPDRNGRFTIDVNNCNELIGRAFVIKSRGYQDINGKIRDTDMTGRLNKNFILRATAVQ